MGMSDQEFTGLREEVRARYAEAARAVLEPAAGATASCCGSSAADSCCGTGSAALDSADCFGGHLYRDGETDGLPEEAVLASLGCGNPLAVADLHEGERVLDLGSGGGIDVLLSARRVGPSGFVYGVDMTEEMLTLARANAARAGAENVEFVKGEIEALPLPDQTVDVVISNCVINLSTDKPAVLAEVFRVLVPGGRSASPTWSPRITCPLPTALPPAHMPGALLAPCPAPSTSPGLPQPGSRTRRSPSPTRPPRLCTQRSSVPSSPPIYNRHCRHEPLAWLTGIARSAESWGLQVPPRAWRDRGEADTLPL